MTTCIVVHVFPMQFVVVKATTKVYERLYCWVLDTLTECNFDWVHSYEFNFFRKFQSLVTSVFRHVFSLSVYSLQFPIEQVSFIYLQLKITT